MAYLEKNSSPAATQRASTAEQAADSAHRAIDRLSESARPTVLRLASSAHRMVDRISGTSDRVAQRLEQTATRLKDAEQQLVGAGSNYIRDHPLKATGIALAAGFLAGRLFAWYRAGRAASAGDSATPGTDQR